MDISTSEYENFISDTMQNQPVINIGMIGHVANGKSTLTKALTGIATQKHSDEKNRNITIRLGYANAKIFKCPSCNAPECYQSCGSSVKDYQCKICLQPCNLMTHVSFTDVPGHHMLMSTMMNGTCIMDYSMLVESCSNPTIPSPQSIEHYDITQKNGVETKIICLNKADLLVSNKQKIFDTVKDIDSYYCNCEHRKDNDNTKIPIIPVSGTHGSNIDVLCEYISKLSIPKKNLSDNLKMLIVRSFNVNSPGTNISEMKGGVVGGSLSRGILKIGQDVCVLPGFINKVNKDSHIQSETDSDPQPTWSCTPLASKVININTDKSQLEYAISGGLVGVELTIDPAFSGDDRLVGQIVVLKSHVQKYKIYEKIKVEYTQKIKQIKKNSSVQININSNNVMANVMKTSERNAYLDLEKPICVELNDKTTISLLENNCIDIAASGVIVDGFGSMVDTNSI